MNETGYVIIDGDTNRPVAVVLTEDANSACAIAKGRTDTISKHLEAIEVEIIRARRNGDK